jgi:hypothetical protein
MSENRNSREADTRETSARPKSWAPPSILPEVNHEEGYAYRYVRVSTMGTPDVNNVSSKFREGWEPVKASDHPEAFTMADPNSRFKDGIETGGLLLCKMPKEFAEQRDTYYQNKTEAEMQAVDNNFMRENDPRMPLFKDKKSQVTFGKGLAK